MAKYEKFEDLPVWQEAARLYNRVLDLLEEPGAPLSPGFRNQLDHAALSVSNSIAAGFERVAKHERLSFLGIARSSDSELRSMIAIVKGRPKLNRFVRQLEEIHALAESCAKQLTGWVRSAERPPEQDRQQPGDPAREPQRAAFKEEDSRENSSRNSRTEQPLHRPAQARPTRGEASTLS